MAPENEPTKRFDRQTRKFTPLNFSESGPTDETRPFQEHKDPETKSFRTPTGRIEKPTQFFRRQYSPDRNSLQKIIDDAIESHSNCDFLKANDQYRDAFQKSSDMMMKTAGTEQEQYTAITQMLAYCVYASEEQKYYQETFHFLKVGWANATLGVFKRPREKFNGY